MDLNQEVSEKIKADERWKNLPYDYAYLSIAAGLTYPQAYAGFLNRLTPEETMFREEGFTEEQIRQWQTI